MRSPYLWFLLFCLCVVSCKNESLRYVSGRLDEAFVKAKENNKKLLVIAYMPGCESCDNFTDNLNQSEKAKAVLGDDYLIYKCKLNQIGNEYMAQVTYNVASPTTYLFNSDGQLERTMIGDKSVDHFISTMINSVDSPLMDGMTFRIGLSGKEYIDFVNIMLEARRLIESPDAHAADLNASLKKVEASIAQRPYFYNNYLAAKLNVKLDQVKAANKFAEIALGYDDSFSVFLYKGLRKEMKYLSNPAQNTASGPILIFEKTSIDLGSNAEKADPVASFRFKNTGSEPLVVKNVIANCDCMEITWPQTPIMPGKNGDVKVVYKGRGVGGYSKVLFVTSNANNEQEKLILTGIIN